MRKLLTLLFIAGFLSAGAAPIKLVVNKGKWSLSNTSIWDLNRVPTSGDIITIPENDTLIIDQNLLGLASITLQINIYGTLYFDGGGAKLALDDKSKVTVYTGGKIYSSVNNSQILQIGDLTQYRGTSAAITGPALATSSTSSFVYFNEAPISLPVKFLGVSATRKNADVLIQWATSQEINAAFYQVERSEDGSNWKSIGSVKAAGTTSVTSNYTFTDRNVSQKIVYYRIKQVDVDNRFEYTAVRVVKADVNSNVVNAVGLRGNIVLQFSKQTPGQVEVRLVSLSGQVVSRQLINRPVGQLILPTTVKGNFILTVTDQQDIQLNKQILL